MVYDPMKCQDHAKRLRIVEGRVAVAEHSISGISKLETTLYALRDSVIGIKTQTKVTWALLIVMIVALVGLAFSIIQSGILYVVP